MLIGYARVSTCDQNPALQIEALTMAGCERLFTERASGAQRDRPELNALLALIQPGDTLIIWKLDRLARSIGHLIEIIRLLDQRQAGFRCLTSAINTSTAEGRLFFHMTAAFAEFERDIIRERTRAGIEAARRRGQQLGRPSKLSQDRMQAALEMLNQPLASVASVAQFFGVSEATLYRHLRINEPVTALQPSPPTRA